MSEVLGRPDRDYCQKKIARGLFVLRCWLLKGHAGPCKTAGEVSPRPK